MIRPAVGRKHVDSITNLLLALLGDAPGTIRARSPARLTGMICGCVCTISTERGDIDAYTKGRLSNGAEDEKSQFRRKGMERDGIGEKGV